ncbi:MAG: hypothetical protein ACRC1H_08740, partial [Caldilineaceae bacterium]
QAEPVGEFMGRRLSPEGTREFWGVLYRRDGAHDPAPGTKLYAAPVAQAEPLTEQEVAEAVFDYYQHFIDPQDAAEACFDKDLAMFRLAERACAEAWGVKLAGIGASTGEVGNG